MHTVPKEDPLGVGRKKDLDKTKKNAARGVNRILWKNSGHAQAYATDIRCWDADKKCKIKKEFYFVASLRGVRRRAG